MHEVGRLPETLVISTIKESASRSSISQLRRSGQVGGGKACGSITPSPRPPLCLSWLGFTLVNLLLMLSCEARE